MKKNFMAIASLLIAAMLLVVSCAPEANVEGKVEDGLVEAVIGLGRSAKDITINNGDTNATIKYQYKMTAAWKSTGTGAPIYGEVSSFKDLPTEENATGYGITEGVEGVSLGKVTPGLWNIEVEGYTNVTTESGEVVSNVVLRGKTSKYFNGTEGEKATVFVAPVSSTNEIVSVEITLKMQDLEGTETANLNQVKYSFTNLNGGDAKEGTMTPNPTPETPLENIKEYKTTVDVRSGFNTVTFSLPGYNGGKGGITKTFLAIPGIDVTIEGSVTPAEFKEGKADIKVLSIKGGDITLTGNEESSKINTKSEPIGNNTVKIYEIIKGKPYTFTYTPKSNTPEIAAAINETIGGYNMERTYQWYVGGVSVTGTSSTETAAKLVFNEPNLGDYNVTCIETITFTKGEGDDKVEHYKIQASTTFEVVRVLEALTQSEPSTQGQ